MIVHYGVIETNWLGGGVEDSRVQGEGQRIEKLSG